METKNSQAREKSFLFLPKQSLWECSRAGYTECTLAQLPVLTGKRIKCLHAIVLAFNQRISALHCAHAIPSFRFRRSGNGSFAYTISRSVVRFIRSNLFLENVSQRRTQHETCFVIDVSLIKAKMMSGHAHKKGWSIPIHLHSSNVWARILWKSDGGKSESQTLLHSAQLKQQPSIE